MYLKQNILVLLLSISLVTNAQYAKLLDFAGSTNGSMPHCTPIYDGTFLYGMTVNGGTSSNCGLYGCGVIFKIKPDGTGYSKLLDFTGTSNGSSPEGSLISDGTFLYGTTCYGGTNDKGVLFKIKIDGTGFIKLLDFGLIYGANPYGSLFSDGTFLYGMTSAGGNYFKGTIFKIKPDGTGYSKLLDFDGNSNGAKPLGSLISDGTFLYGMTYIGGTYSVGVVFKIKPDGTGYSKLLDFVGTSTGKNPAGSLFSDGVFLYGMTIEGGANNYGVIFKMKFDGTGYIKMHDFIINQTGAGPRGSFIFDGTFLYGMTVDGGTNNSGVIFKIKPDGTGFIKMLDFAGSTNGENPLGSFVYDGSTFYGTTSVGGANDIGTMFKYSINSTGVVENKINSDITIFPNPFSTQINIQPKDNFNEANIIVYNGQGEQVREVKKISGRKYILFRDDLPNGLYFIQIIQDGQLIGIEKLILED